MGMSFDNNLPTIYAFCKKRLERNYSENDPEGIELHRRLELSIHYMRAIGASPQAENEVREIAALFAYHPRYVMLGLGGDAGEGLVSRRAHWLRSLTGWRKRGRRS